MLDGLTTQQKLDIVRETRRVLGRGGKNWVKGAWYAVKHETPSYAGSFTKITPVPMKQATCFCLEGAVNKAIFNLGLAPYSEACRWRTVPARIVSLKAIARKLGFSRVNQLNDDHFTNWRKVKSVLDMREAELLAELEKEVA